MGGEIKNITAERLVIGILLNNPEWLVELNGLIKTEYFYLTGHKVIFHLIATLLKEGKSTIDSMSILARAEKIAKATQVLEQNGGIEYLEELQYLAENQTIEDLNEYVDEVTTCSFKREQIRECLSIVAELEENKEMTISQVETLVQTKQQRLMNDYSSNSQVYMLDDIFDETWQEIEENRQDDGVVGLPSKFELLNEYCSYQNGELTVYGGRAKYGKSNFAINETHHLAVELGVPVAYFDTEMKTKTFIIRIISIDSGVPLKEITNGTYLKDKDKVKKVEKSKIRVKNAPIIHLYDPYWTKDKIKHKAKLLKLRYNIGILIYDYIKVMEVGKGVKEHSELGNWTIFLKNLAGILDIPILTFAQLSPHELRIADSDKINRYASTIGYLLPKTPEMIRKHIDAEEGGTDYIYIEYNRVGADMTDGDEGINICYDRNTATMKQAPYQVLKIA